jgi:hypothetical protein
MESITEMGFNNPMYDAILTKISRELLLELLEICKIKRISFSALLEYSIKSNCMQALFVGGDIKEVASANNVADGTVYDYNTELSLARKTFPS